MITLPLYGQFTAEDRKLALAVKCTIAGAEIAHDHTPAEAVAALVRAGVPAIKDGGRWVLFVKVPVDGAWVEVGGAPYDFWGVLNNPLPN